MKRQLLFSLIIAILFVATNTSLLWNNNDIFDFLGRNFLMVALLIIGVIQLISIGVMAHKKGFQFENTFLVIFNIGLLIILFFYPHKIIGSPEKREVFIEAFSEGTTHCTTCFKLFKNNEFEECNVCFGNTHAEGTYRIVNDTIFFDTKIIPRYIDQYYKFAIIQNGAKEPEIIRFYKLSNPERNLQIKRK